MANGSATHGCAWRDNMRGLFFILRNLARLPVNVWKRNRVSILARVCSGVCMNRCKVGQYTYIGRNAILNGAVIGNYCSIAPSTQIGGMEHSYWWYSTSQRLSDQCVDNKTTTIGHDVWIGAGTVIRQGVTIGDGAIIGALSFVNKDVPENTVCFGIPAKVSHRRLPEGVFRRLVASQYWGLSIRQAKRLLRNMEAQYRISGVAEPGGTTQRSCKE